MTSMESSLSCSVLAFGINRCVQLIACICLERENLNFLALIESLVCTCSVSVVMSVEYIAMMSSDVFIGQGSNLH